MAMELDEFLLGAARQESEANAAVKIQAVYRGSVARKSLGAKPGTSFTGSEATVCSDDQAEPSPAPGSELQARLAQIRSRADGPGTHFENAPAASVADVRCEWIFRSAANVGWDEVQKAAAADPKQLCKLNLAEFFPSVPLPDQAGVASAGFDAPEDELAPEADSDSDDLASWDNSAAMPSEPQDLSGAEMKELVSRLQHQSLEAGQLIVKALPRRKVLALARLVMQARRSPQKRGWLWKRGPTSSYGWQRRWVVLSHSGIDYYADEAEQERKGSIRLGTGTRAVAFRSHEGLQPCSDVPFGFVVEKAEHPDVGGMPRLFYFDALSEEALQEWVPAINAMGQP